MPRIETLIDLYIDANILLILAFVVWRVAMAIMRRSRLKHDFSAQLRLSEGAMLALMLSPLIALALSQGLGMVFPGQSLSAADLALAHFLDGRIAMDAERFEGLLGARQSFVAGLVGPGNTVTKVGAALLLSGAVLSALSLGRGALRLRRLLRQSYLWRRQGRVDIRLSDAIAVPFSTRSLSRRYVVVPTDMLGRGDELRIALAHEFQHLRRPDLESEVLTAFLRPLFFWNPVFVLWRRDLADLRELACDQRLLRERRVSPQAYAKCLLHVCRDAIARREDLHPAAPNVALLMIRRRHNRAALRRRIETIVAVDAPPSVSQRTPIILAGCIACAIGLGAAAMQKPGDWSQDRLMLSTIVNLDRLETRNIALQRLSGF
ncbi:MAG: M56 family metallopeptidase [Pseudomonadota bacterium]